MLRYIVSIVAVLALATFTSTAFGAKKGFYIGGSLVNHSMTGDLDGETQLINDDGDRAGNVGKPDRGRGLAIDLGYNFGKNFGLEYMEFASLVDATHENESSSTLASVSGALAGIRLSGPLGDSFDVFTRLGIAVARVAYLDYGHEGTVGPPFTPTSDETFTLTGAGVGFGIGAEWMVTKSLGFGIGVTVLNVAFDSASVGDEDFKLKKELKAALRVTDVTVLWHF